MQKYIFILGQASDLAKQEILSFLELKKESSVIIGSNFIIAESDLSAEQLMLNLGSTIKVAVFLEELKDIGQITAENFLNWLDLTPEEHKINFGLSIYNTKAKEAKILQKIAFAAKKILKEKNQSARLVTGQSFDLSSVIVAKNKLIGREILLIKNQQKWLVGKTLAVQDFENYGFRDMERPARDSRSGMLPPKLAQTMLNLAGPKRDLKILDPFCGSGTILQEAALLNFKNIYGQDLSSKAVQDTKDNIDWLKNNFQIESKIEIKQGSVENLSREFKEKIDLIVTEPLMGDARNIQRMDSSQELAQEAEKLNELYCQAFSEFHKICAEKAKVIFIFPIFNLRDKKIPSLEEKQIEALGWKSIKPDFDSPLLSENKNIIYQRPEQKVLREITIWQKK
ncbi:methyltransferase domain-containing protein [Candidatus Nomurabacteria bacterium]|nr:methyltransferase domain-containing protein [Candidatus Nomurabacteria bacterium]